MTPELDEEAYCKHRCRYEAVGFCDSETHAQCPLWEYYYIKQAEKYGKNTKSH